MMLGIAMLQIAGSPIEAPPPRLPQLNTAFACVLSDAQGRAVGTLTGSVSTLAARKLWDEIDVSLVPGALSLPTVRSGRSVVEIVSADRSRWSVGDERDADHRVLYQFELNPAAERTGTVTIKRTSSTKYDFIATGICTPSPIGTKS